MAAARPAGPPPAINTSVVVIHVSLFFPSSGEYARTATANCFFLPATFHSGYTDRVPGATTAFAAGDVLPNRCGRPRLRCIYEPKAGRCGVKSRNLAI